MPRLKIGFIPIEGGHYYKESLEEVTRAEAVAMLDVMSGGRVTLGIAIGYKPDEFALYGVPLEKRGARFEEQLAIMKGLWTQERVSFQGRYYSVEGRLEPKP